MRLHVLLLMFGDFDQNSLGQKFKSPAKNHNSGRKTLLNGLRLEFQPQDFLGMFSYVFIIGV